METVFQNNGLYCLLALLVGAIVAFVFSVVLCLLSYFQHWTAKEMLHLAMVIKLVHIPGYLLIFFWGLLCAFTIFTIGFSVVLAILDGISIGMTGLIGAFGVQKAYHTGQLNWKEGLLHGILQFVFCADVVSIVALYLKIKNGQKC